MKSVTRFLCLAQTLLIGSCAFNFEITSQKTALENQMIGGFREIEDPILIVDSDFDERSHQNLKFADAKPSLLSTSMMPRQHFNLDDIEELKDNQIIGETNQGTLAILPQGVGLRDAATEEQIRLAELLIAEENADRATIKTEKKETSDSENIEVDSANRRALSKKGQWIQNSRNEWMQKK